MEQDFNHFAVIEKRLLNEENHLFEKNTSLELLPEFYLSRFLLTLTAVPTLLVTLIAYVFKFRILYLLLFFGLYYGLLTVFNETHFEWISDAVIRLRRLWTR